MLWKSGVSSTPKCAALWTSSNQARGHKGGGTLVTLCYSPACCLDSTQGCWHMQKPIGTRHTDSAQAH